MNRQARQSQKKQVKAWVKLSKKPPSDRSKCLGLADNLCRAREWAAAERCYAACLNKAKNDFSVLMKLAYVQACSNQLKRAVETYKRCYSLDSEDYELLKNMAAMSQALGLPEEGLEYALKVSNLSPSDPNALYLVAECYADMQKKDEAETYYQKALTKYRESKLDATTLIKISRCLSYTGQTTAALNCLHQAVQANPNIPGAYFEMAKAFEKLNDTSKAKMAYRRTLELAPQHTEALEQYAELMAMNGQLDKSAWAYRRLLRIFPDSSTFKHFLKASEQETHSSVDDQYIADVFDSYASQFEEHLVKTLHYNIPKKIHDLFESYWNQQALNIVDLGCGTGLCGPLFKHMASTLIGVDLSKAMLAEAGKKAVYDELKLSELVSALRAEYCSQDLLVAADVLIYVGALDELFKAAYQSLKPGGYFVFSVEASVAQELTLEVSGRYKHSESYVRRQAAMNSFEVHAAEPVTIRMESDQPVAGLIFLLSK